MARPSRISLYLSFRPPAWLVFSPAGRCRRAGLSFRLPAWLVLSPTGVARRKRAWQIAGKPLTSSALSLMRIKSNWSAPMLTANAREQMIEQQVRAWDVLDERVLGIFRKIPREHFVPESQRYKAYMDLEIPLPKSQHMLRPSVVGRLLQALELTGTERVLEIGAGSGFITACLAAVSAHVESIEIIPELAELAKSNLATLSIGNTH